MNESYSASRPSRGAFTIGVAAALIAGVSIGNIGPNAMPVLLDDFAPRFSMTDAVAGRVAAAQLLAMAFTTLLLAQRAASPGRTRLARMGLSVGALGCLGAAAAQGPIGLFTANLVMGIGLGAVYAAATAALAATGDADRASSLAIVGSALVTAGLLVLLPIVNGIWGNGTGFILLAVAFVPVAWLVRQLPESPVTEHNVDSATSSPGVLLLLGAAVVASVGQGAWSYAAKLGRIHTHMSGAAVSAILAVSGVLAIAGAVAGPFVARRWGRARAMSIFVCGDATMMCTVLITSSEVTFALAAVAWEAFQLAFLVELLAAAAMADASGRWVAALGGASAVGAGIGPPVIGAALESVSSVMVAVLLACIAVVASTPLLRMAVRKSN